MVFPDCADSAYTADLLRSLHGKGQKEYLVLAIK